MKIVFVFLLLMIPIGCVIFGLYGAWLKDHDGS